MDLPANARTFPSEPAIPPDPDASDASDASGASDTAAAALAVRATAVGATASPAPGPDTIAAAPPAPASKGDGRSAGLGRSAGVGRPTGVRRPTGVGRTAGIAVAASVGVLALVVGFGPGPLNLPGLPSPGTGTYWTLPFARLVGRIAAIGTIGWLLAAAVLIPGRGGSSTRRGRPLTATAQRCGRYAANAAVVWLLAALAELLFTVSEVSARPVGDVLDIADVRSFISASTQGQALLAVAVAALTVAMIGRTAVTTTAAGALLAVAVAGLVPPILVGHASTSGDHAVAVVTLGLHVLAATAWVGGLVGLLTAVRLPLSSFGPALRRYSRFAAGAATATAITGIASAALRLGGVAPLWNSRYGALVLLKAAGLIVAVALGGWLRRRVVARLSMPAAAEATVRPRDGDGTPSPPPHPPPSPAATPATTPGPAAAAAVRPGAIGRFARIAGVELTVLAATVGLAVGLSRTAPPVDDSLVPDDATQALLGYPMPPPVTAVRLAMDWRIDWVFLGAAVIAALLYLAAVRRLMVRGDRWPVGRTIAWLSGLAVMVIATSSGLGRYGPVLLSVHMGQHMLLSMLAPIPLVLGSPMTLALRAMRPAAAPHRTGPREWLVAALRSWPVRILTNPLIVTVNFVGSLYVLYLTSLLSTLMHNHLGHLYMNVHFLVAGFLFFELLIGTDPLPRRLPHVGRIGMLLSVVPFHTFLGLSIMNMSTLLGSGWYDRLVRPWGVTPLSDQRTAGGIVWSFGELPTFVVLIVLIIQWSRMDDRRTRTRERRIASAGVDAELDAYNAYLARLNAGPTRRAPAARSGAAPGAPGEDRAPPS